MVELLENRRDRLVATSGFRVAATAFPLTRPIARSRALALFELCAGVPRAQLLFAAVRLDLPELLLREGPLDADAIAARLSLPSAAARTLCRGAAAIGLLRECRGRFALGPLGTALCDDPGLAAMVLHGGTALPRDLADPVVLLRDGAGGSVLERFWPYAAPRERDGDGGAGEAGSYSALMAATQPAIAREALRAAPFGRFRRLLDVGGGNGAFLEAVLRRHRRLRGAVLDLPPVAALAAARFRAAGLSDRAVGLPGNFRHDPLPAGFDAVSLNRVLHDHDDQTVLALLRAVRAALPPRGTLLVIEPMAGADPAGRATESYFGLYLRAMGGGRPRRDVEYAAMLRAAGFRRVRALRTRLPLVTRVLMARP
ncbi:MAG: methyltransferase domain-containing protein [Gluconacetobacter diazotrophicus]|nr:methyltransferase domain-containing protein [Gluconacetobacter diazotrophicus]